MVSRNGKVHAFDVDRPSIDILRQKKEVYRLDNICVHEKDVTQGLDLEARSIDLVVLANVLHGFVHNSEWPPVLEEVARVLKLEGRLLTIEFRKDQTPFGPPLDLRLSVNELRDLLIGYGFTTSKTSDLGTAHYMALSVR